MGKKRIKINSTKSYGFFQIKDVKFHARPIKVKERKQLDELKWNVLARADNPILKMLAKRIAGKQQGLPKDFLHDLTPTQYSLIHTVLTRPDTIKIKTSNGMLTDVQPQKSYEDELEVVNQDKVMVTFFGYKMTLGEILEPEYDDDTKLEDLEKAVETQFINTFVKRISKADMELLEASYKEQTESKTVDAVSAILYWWDALDEGMQGQVKDFMYSPDALKLEEDEEEDAKND